MKGGENMKKAYSLLFLLTMALSLTSCKVNWFGETREVAWYFVVIPILLVLVIAYAIIMTNTYICPHCGRKSFCNVQKR